MINPLLSISVLVVEDDDAVATVLTNYLERSGMPCARARTAAEAMQAVTEFKPSVALVDLGLPDAHGVGLIPWLAQHGACGIIVVTGAAAEADRVVGIELGADDYVVKPPALRELVARIRAVHRRRTHGGPASEPEPAHAAADPGRAPAPARSDWLRLGDCMICRETATVQRMDGEQVHLTGAERKVMELLLAAGREPVSRSVLCEEALRRPLGAEDRAIDQIILALRRKLGVGGRDLIMSVRGAGYALAPQPSAPLPHLPVPAPAVHGQAA